MFHPWMCFLIVHWKSQSLPINCQCHITPLRQGPSSCGKLVAGTMKSASAPILQGLDDLSLDDFLGSSSEESNSPRTVPHNIANGSSSSAFSLGSIFVRYPQKCLQMFYIRLDRSGSFWMYPYLGGPYKRIDDVDFAITLFDVTYHRDR
jgi:hypothetical protein